MRVSPCRSALSALAHRAQAARSQWGSGRAVSAQTPGSFHSTPWARVRHNSCSELRDLEEEASRSPGVDSGEVLFVTSNSATFSISRRVSQENKDKGGGKARDRRRQREMERRRESNRKAKKKVGKQRMETQRGNV